MVAAAAFELRAVAHLIQPWGTPARDLEQLRAGIAAAPIEVVFHHTVQYQLRHPGAEELPPDDFSAWIAGVVQDAETAERLSFAVQSGGRSGPAARAALLRVLESLPARRRSERDAPEESAFSFLAATAVSFPTGIVVHDGRELVEALTAADAGVWFRHLVEEPWFLQERAPLLEWLTASGERRLAEWLVEDAGAGLPIEKARARLVRRWRQSRIARQVTDAAAVPEDVRRDAGRQAVARFVRRVRRPSGPS